MSEQEINGIIARNITHHLNRCGKSQVDLADYMNVSQATVSNWCKGVKLPRMDKIDKICGFFNIHRSDLMNEKTNSLNISHKKGVTISVLGCVAAGIPIEAVEDIIDTEEITEDMAKTGSFFGLRIHGNSMEPRMTEGDVVIVRQQNDAESGDIVIVTVNGDNATCKRLKKYDNGIALLSTNPDYDPMFFSCEDVVNKPVRIIGKVVELRAKF